MGAKRDFHNAQRRHGFWRRMVDTVGAKIPGGDRIKRLFRRALGVADVILDSLAKAFPVAEGLKQIKEGVEKVTAD
jgi:hypothetical protein